MPDYEKMYFKLMAKIADVIDNYLAGEITDIEAIHLARALPYTYQLSLHSQEAIELVDDQNVWYKEFHKNRWTRDWMQVRINK